MDVTATMPDAPLTVRLLADHAFGRPDSEIIWYDEPGHPPLRTTIGGIEPRVRRLAGGLARLGIRRGERVGTLMWNRLEHFEAYIAVPCAGFVLHTVNVRLAPHEIAYIVEHAEDAALIVDDTLIDVALGILPELPSVRVLVVTGRTVPSLPATVAGRVTVVAYDQLLDESEPMAAWPELDERAPAGMCYTSGTTGRPKGVVYSHRSTVLHSMSVCSANAVGLSATDRAMIVVPMFHANAWGWPYAALAAGAALVLPGRHLDPGTIAAHIERERVTLTGGVPTLWNDVLRHAEGAAVAPDLSSLRLILCGGSVVPRTLIDAYSDRFGVRLVQAWGMTEVSPLGGVAWPGGRPDDVTAQARFLFGVSARVVADDGEVLSDEAAVGEVEVRGPWVTERYHRDEDPQAFDDGWLRTGDIGSVDRRGYLRLTDRSKDVIKSGGEWISSVELEAQLSACPGVAEAAVIGVADERWQERPLAVIATADGSADPAALRSWLDGRVPRWWLPERWVFVDAVPRTSVGKFDKRLLREQYAAGALGPVHTVGASHTEVTGA